MAGVVEGDLFSQDITSASNIVVDEATLQFLDDHIQKLEYVLTTLLTELTNCPSQHQYVPELIHSELMIGYINSLVSITNFIERSFDDKRIRKPYGKYFWRMLPISSAIRVRVVEALIALNTGTLTMPAMLENDQANYINAQELLKNLNGLNAIIHPERRNPPGRLSPNRLVPDVQQNVSPRRGMFIDVPDVQQHVSPGRGGEMRQSGLLSRSGSNTHAGGRLSPNQLIPSVRSGSIISGHQPTQSWSYQSAMDSQQNIFGMPAYVQFLRQNIRVGSQLMVWRDSPARGCLLTLGERVTVIEGGEPEPRSNFITVTRNSDPCERVTHVDLNSVYLILVDTPELSLDQFAGSIRSQEYYEFLQKNVKEGSGLRLWQDCPYSGLKKNTYLTVSFAYLVQNVVNADYVHATVNGDPTLKVHQVGLRCCFLYNNNNWPRDNQADEEKFLENTEHYDRHITGDNRVVYYRV